MKKSKINRFFKIVLCVIVSIAFWTLNKFSKKSKSGISLKVNITDLPENLVLDSISSKKINLKIEGIGAAKTSKQEINISAKNKSNNFLHISKKEIESQLEANLKVINIYPDSIFLFTSKKEINKIPIKHNIEVNFKENYWIKKTIKINPDSILIKGNKKHLKETVFLETENLKLFDVSEKKTGIIFLKPNIFFEEKVPIEYTIEPEKYTEGNLELGIDLINFPINKEVLLFPKKILVKYLVSELRYHEIQEDDFKIVCDFKNTDISKKYCKINIIKKPLDIKIIQINEKIEFLIQ